MFLAYPGSLFHACDRSSLLIISFILLSQVIYIDDQVTSYLQTRGSVPLFWEQPGFQVGQARLACVSLYLSCVLFSYSQSKCTMYWLTQSVSVYLSCIGTFLYHILCNYSLAHTKSTTVSCVLATCIM